MAQKQLRMVLALLLTVLSALCGRTLASRVLSDVGVVVLSRALSALPSAEYLQLQAQQAGGKQAARFQELALAARPEKPNPRLLDEAERWLSWALQWDPENQGAHNGLGWLWDARGDLPRAAQQWQKAGLTAGDFSACAQSFGNIQWRTEIELWLARAQAMAP